APSPGSSRTPATAVIPVERSCGRRRLAPAATAPGCAAPPPPPAAAATAPPAAATATATASAAAPAAPAAPPGERRVELRLSAVFLVEDVERHQADVGNLFLAERDLRMQYRVERLIVGDRSGGRPDAPPANVSDMPAAPITGNAVIRRARFEVFF